MKAIELIESLKNLDPDEEIFIETSCGCCGDFKSSFNLEKIKDYYNSSRDKEIYTFRK